MPDTVTRFPGRRALMRYQEFTDYQRPALARMLAAALDYASAAEDYRQTELFADAVTEHDFSVEDTLGGMLNHLSNALGTIRARLDDDGMDPDRADLDLGDLIRAHAEAKVRADARRPNPTGPALVEALRASLDGGRQT